ncbi:MAG: glycerol-3-phosphate acyltransferase [Chloroflexota bacterium]
MSIIVGVIPLLGYVCGSMTFSIWVTSWVKGVDVRDAGSGHASATNTIRQAGWLPGALVAFLDISKGFLPTYLAVRAGLPNWGIGLTAGFAVIGHCWPLFAGFRGGMGLATLAGGLLATSPLSMLIGLGLLISLVLILHHSARGSAITGLLLAPLLWFIGFRGPEFWVGSIGGVVIFFRFLSDWSRKYRELWLDRET